MMRKNIETYYPKYSKMSDLGSKFGASCLTDSRASVFFATRFSEPLGGYPLGPIWPPLGHPWSDFVDLLEDFSSNFAPIFKDSRAMNGTNHTFKKTSEDSNKYR